MQGPRITVMGETDLHTLAVIQPAHDTHFGMLVGDVIDMVAGRHGFENLHQLALKTHHEGRILTRGTFLEFEIEPVVHMISLKGRKEEEEYTDAISWQYRVFRYRDGGPCMKIKLNPDAIDLSALLFEACINFDLEIEDYELDMIGDHQPYDYYLKFKE